MEVRVLEIPIAEQEEVVIRCHKVTDQISEIENFIKSRQGTIRGLAQEKQYEIRVADIFYAEAVENRVFLYTEKEVYETKWKLYELEDQLKEKAFLRISKSVIVNLLKIDAFKPAMNGRFVAELTNGEEVIISRKYVPVLKERIKNRKE